MLQPTRLISTPFAQEGNKTQIQNVAGEFDNSATYQLGFPPITMQSIRSGGKPPKGTDFNGVLFDITENISFLCKGGRYQYNAGLSTLIGGYPEGSNLLLDDNVTEVVSTVAGNQNNPNINMTGWILKPNKTTAVNVADASGETQQQVNYNGGAKWHSRVGGYQENECVVLANGDIVKSTIDGNANDPNVDMTGWEYNPVNLKLNTIANSIKRTLTEVVYDQIIDVTWFGANGNWDKETQTGFDSTQAFQNAIAYLATLATRRKGGKRGLKIPKGSYLITSITFPESLGFGLDIIGDGVKTTNLYFDHTVLTPAMTCNIEFVQFRNMSLIGTRDEATYTTRTDGFIGKLPNNYPDIDVTFFNCEIVYWNTFAKIHGRGCIFESCSLGLIIRAMDIVCSDSIIYGADTDNMQSKYATMRHYTFRNCRFDNVSRAYAVSGSGFMLDYINSVVFIANDITNMDILFDAPTATICNSNISVNTAIGSFATRAFNVKTIKNSTVLGNNSCKLTNVDGVPNSGLIATEYFIDATEPFKNLIVIGNNIKGLSKAFIRNTSTQPSEGLVLINNSHPEFGTYKGGNSTISYLLMSANGKQVSIKNNTFTSSNVSGNYYLFNFNGVQLSKDIEYSGNTSPFNFLDRLFSFAPKVYVGATPTTGVTNTAYAQYKCENGYAVGKLFVGGTVPETSGSMFIDLPVLAIAEIGAYSSSYSGGSTISNQSGLSSVGYTLANAVVSSSSQRIELKKEKDLVVTNITAADIPSTYSMVVDFRYRIK